MEGEDDNRTGGFGSRGLGLMRGDWRVPGTGSPMPTADRPASVRSALGPAALHHGARKASFVQERRRAQQIVSIARQRIGSAFEDARFGKALNVDQLWPLVSGINASITRHPAALMGVTRLKDRHEYTYLHSVAVCGLMIGLARRLNIDPALHHDIGLAGLLHDIGKARVPASILDKPATLTDDEQSVIRQHSQWGYEMLITGDKLPDLVLDVCLHHHERLDGCGYPDNRTGPNISLYSRMAAICDVYDAVTSARAYKAAWSPAEALEYLAANPGQFDPALVSPFSAMIGIFPVGSMVRLTSNRLAVVLESSDPDEVAPPVSPFFCIDTRKMLPGRRIDSAVDPIVGIELPSRWNLPFWPATRAGILAEFAEGPADSCR